MKRKAATLKGDDDGYGTVKFEEWFATDAPLYRCDVLKDWIALLEAEYTKAHGEMMAQWQKLAPKKETKAPKPKSLKGSATET